MPPGHNGLRGPMRTKSHASSRGRGRGRGRGKGKWRRLRIRSKHGHAGENGNPRTSGLVAQSKMAPPRKEGASIRASTLEGPAHWGNPGVGPRATSQEEEDITMWGPMVLQPRPRTGT